MSKELQKELHILAEIVISKELQKVLHILAEIVTNKRLLRILAFGGMITGTFSGIYWILYGIIFITCALRKCDCRLIREGASNVTFGLVFIIYVHLTIAFIKKVFFL